MANDNSAGWAISPFTLCFFIFMTLKLCGVIDWSWWWVAAPLWMPVALIGAMALIIGIIVLIAKQFKDDK